MFNETIIENSSVNIDNRNKLRITGVIEVDTFEQNGIVLSTALGQLTVRGSNLKLISLENDTGTLTVEGYVNGVLYTDDINKSSVFKRLFR